MRVPIIMPQLGESIAEAMVIRIAVTQGDQVSADQEIIEVETNKALLQVTTPCAGEVLELNVAPQQTYAVGEILGYVEAAPAEVERLGLKPGSGPQDDEVRRDVAQAGPATNGHVPFREPAGESHADSDGWQTAGAGLPVPAKLAGAGYFSPRLRARLGELGLKNADLAGLPGTGADGRVTVADLEKYVSALQSAATEPAPAMRLAVGEALSRSIARPLATVGRPVCLDLLLAARSRQPEPKPAFVLYVMRALALALAADPAPAGRIVGKRFLPAGSIDLGCAVEVDGGLMVPVLRAVDGQTVGELNGRFQELIAAARRRQLPPDATGGAVATVSNFGIFGLKWATPIPLPDESLMLGLGAARKTPSWDEAKGAFVPVMEAELTLTFDHRVLDGGSAGRLLDKVGRLLQEPERL
jgi:pyruvate/2-oxoglutarate dehydrogenase complex dihydrolipoamide acyltransferase (E2) component